VASKTGTQGKQGSTVDDTDAYMVGYTPSISTAVWMGSDGQDAIVNAQGKPIYGSGLPGAIWQEFMNAVLKGTPKEPLPSKALIKGDTGVGVPDPTETPTPTSEAPAPTTQAAPDTATNPPTNTATETPTNTTPPTDTNPNTGGPQQSGLPLPGIGQGGLGGSRSQDPGGGQGPPNG
jgi:membrane peptidoglycan carboxypeptidase